VALGAFMPQAVAQTFLTNGLVAYYPFNGNANDESGNGNNGTVQGSTLTTDRFGVPGHAYAFNGFNDLVVIPETLFGPTNPAVTISLWITTDNGPYGGDWQDIFEKGSKNGEMTLAVKSGQIYFYPHLTGNVTSFAASAPILSDSVMHVIGVYEKGQAVSLYMNGVLASSTNLPNADLNVVTGFPLLSAIGAYDYTPGPYGGFRGVIDDVRVYTRALSASEIQQLYQYESQILCIPRRATATAEVVNGFVVGATITDGGCGYTNAPAVAIEGGGGSGAIATAVISNGVVVGITIWDAGRGYTSTPTVYIYSPLGLQIGLTKAVRPFFSDLLIGTNYQLQVSGDLDAWTNSGSPFPATSRSMAYPQYWDVDNWNQLFFRLQIAP
jgi:hypothetical protein